MTLKAMKDELKPGDIVLINYIQIYPVLEPMKIHDECIGIVEKASDYDRTCYYVERGEWAAYIWPIECLTKIGTL